MVSQEVTIQNKLGIHARPAAQFVKTANSYQSDVMVEKDNEEIDGKSIMGLMMLAAGNGSTLNIKVTGEDEQAALDALVKLVNDKFGEE